MVRQIGMLPLYVSLLLVFFDILLPEALSAQSLDEVITDRRDASVWYFGRNAGISFAEGEPVALTDGQLNTLDGAAVACSPKDGRLLFYTDGATVWNTAHQVMPNGTGLKGNESSGQPALIVPAPGDTNLFYIFTTGAANMPDNAFRYSIVDMSKNNGTGDVTVKNIVLVERGTEQVTATRHCNGRDYWVISHEWATNQFHVFPVRADGVGKAIITKIGDAYPSAGDIQGTMQISPNGAYLAVSAASLNTLEVFDFNSEVGIIENRRVVARGVRYYGIEFSPDNSKLYTTTLPIRRGTCTLYQVDLTSENLNKSYVLYEYEGVWIGGQLQLAPDGRIYVSFDGRDYLGVINRPNELAADCEYINDGFYLQGKSTSYGLPNFIDSDVFGVTNSALCIEEVKDTSTVDSTEIDSCTVRFSANVRLIGSRGHTSGELFTVPVWLEHQLDQAGIRSLAIRVEYDSFSMRLEDSWRKMLQGTLLDGWQITNFQHEGGTILIDVRAPSGSYLQDTGTLLNLPFRMYFSFRPTLSANLSMEITAPEDTCVTLHTIGDRVEINSICGLNFRLMELASAGRYSLEVPQPHPIQGKTDIRFSIGLDGETRLDIIDLSGNVRAVLVNDYLPPGEYIAQWHPASLSSGIYFCRLVSGDWSMTTKLVIRQ